MGKKGKEGEKNGEKERVRKGRGRRDWKGEGEGSEGEKGRGGIFGLTKVNLGCKFDHLTLQLEWACASSSSS